MAFEYSLTPDRYLANYWTEGGLNKPKWQTPTMAQFEANPNNWYASSGGGYLTGPAQAYGGQNVAQQQGREYNAVDPIPYQPFAYGQTRYAAASPAMGLANDFGGLMGAGASNPYDLVNSMSSGNMRAMYGPAYQYQGTVDTNRSNERMQAQQIDAKQSILGGLLPSILSALGSFGSGGPTSFSTNYGAGGSLGSQAQPTDVQAMRRNPVLDVLARMGMGGQ